MCTNQDERYKRFFKSFSVNCWELTLVFFFLGASVAVFVSWARQHVIAEGNLDIRSYSFLLSTFHEFTRSVYFYSVILPMYDNCLFPPVTTIAQRIQL